MINIGVRSVGLGFARMVPFNSTAKLTRRYLQSQLRACLAVDPNVRYQG